jgi:hypothetical protein
MGTWGFPRAPLVACKGAELVGETKERDKGCRNEWVYMWEMIVERCLRWGFIADARIYDWHALNVMPNYMLGAV